jgi:uncharacterized membrane protein
MSRFGNQFFARLAVICSFSYFFILYSFSGFRAYNDFQVQNFDYGINYQSTQLLARRALTYLTVRGDFALADNQKYFQVFVAPLHYLSAPHYWLIGAYSFGILLSGLALLLFFPNRIWLGLSLSIFFWMSPFLINMNADLMHIECFATLWIVLMGWSMKDNHPKLFYLFLFMALLCKEDIAIYCGALAIAGILTKKLFRLQKKHYYIAIGLSLAMFFTNLLVVLPHYKLLSCAHLGQTSQAIGSFKTVTPSCPWFQGFYEKIGHLQFWQSIFLRKSVFNYIALIFWPVLPFIFSLPFLVLAVFAPALVNILSSSEYLISGFFHYDHSTMALIGLTLAMALSRSSSPRIIIAYLFLGTFVNYNILTMPHSPLKVAIRAQLSEPFSKSFWHSETSSKVKMLENLNQKIPTDTIIAADYVSLNYLLPGHDQVYMLPNPFSPSYFGVYGMCERPAQIPFPDLIVAKSGTDLNKIDPQILKQQYLQKEILVPDENYKFIIYIRKNSTVKNLFSWFENI